MLTVDQVYLTQEDIVRRNLYSRYEALALGRHKGIFDTRDLKIGKKTDLVYIAINLPGLISRLSMDFLFEEFPTIRLPDGDEEYLKHLVYETDLRVKLAESAF